MTILYNLENLDELFNTLSIFINHCKTSNIHPEYIKTKFKKGRIELDIPKIINGIIVYGE